MNAIQIQRAESKMDASVNFLLTGDTQGKFEARYVRRSPEKVSIYLSSQKGCDLACRFCHLTQMGETSTEQASFNVLRMQMQLVMEHVKEQASEHGIPLRYEVNFMARGEALRNPVIMDPDSGIFAELRSLTGSEHTTFNISTIFPKDVDLEKTTHLWERPDTELFYSLYTLTPYQRKRWIPKALDPQVVGKFLGAVQARENLPITLHHCFIAGMNDTMLDCEQLVEWAKEHHIRARVNIVRFNSADPQYRETPQDKLDKLFKYLWYHFDPKSRIVDRVGPDVAAACGMFL